MNAELAAAGLICVALGVGHETIGVVWVLPHLGKEHLSPTPFGPSSMTLAMLRVTWHIVTIFVLTLAGLLLTLAWAGDADPKIALLRWFAASWFVAVVIATSIAGMRVRNLRYLIRLPVPIMFLVVSMLCWKAST